MTAPPPVDALFAPDNGTETTRRLRDIDRETRAANELGIPVRLLTKPDELANSATTIGACATCRRPFIAIAPPADPVKYCRKECSHWWKYDPRRNRTVQTAPAPGPRKPPQGRPSCPRPDKKAWGTIEAARQVVSFMRSRDHEATALDAYLCPCGWHHVGNRSSKSA